MVVDATAVCSLGGQAKRYRLLHTVYDVGAQRFCTTLMTDRSVAERLDVGAVAAGEIRLGDRVYGRYGDLAAVAGAGPRTLCGAFGVPRPSSWRPRTASLSIGRRSKAGGPRAAAFQEAAAAAVVVREP